MSSDPGLEFRRFNGDSGFRFVRLSFFQIRSSLRPKTDDRPCRHFPHLAGVPKQLSPAADIAFAKPNQRMTRR